ncbi:uncharacterized protein LOC126608941 isoform X1 [Malus sylvestris]|uniref:uncharacterized protein LOC126608941 isoform X1 n=1 Tax=Malus sylvestris TaxID=3752 RepID=UPI0021ABB002|nr:uncharacterized protein LOC126608941 isoform X1 [Malus sylvestris]
MGFVSFLGRVLFASIFILSAWQAFNEFGVDGGPAAKDLAPKFNVFKKNLSAKLGVAIPEIEEFLVQVRHLAAGVVAMKGLGGLLFVLNSSFGASLLLLQLAITTPLIYDFYNYSPENAKFGILLNEFLQGPRLLRFNFLSTARSAFWCTAFLHWHEELNSKEASQKEGCPKNQNGLEVYQRGNRSS